MKSYCFLCTIAAYLDIVENITPLSMVFENNLLMAYEVVMPAVQETIAWLETLSEESADELSQESFFHMVEPSILAGRAKQWEGQNITTDQLLWSSTCCSKFW